MNIISLVLPFLYIARSLIHLHNLLPLRVSLPFLPLQPTTNPTFLPTKIPTPILNPTPAPVPPSDTSLTVSKTAYTEGEDIVIDFDHPDNQGLDAWIGMWPAESDPQALPSPSDYWNYICSDSQSSACGAHLSAGVVSLNADSEEGGNWPLTCGSWRAYLIPSGACSLSYSSVAASEAFTVGTSANCEASPTRAPVPPSGTSLTVFNTVYAEGEDILIDFDYSDNPGLGAWIGLWPADSDPQALPSPSAYWNYICSNSQSSACGTHPTAGVVTLNADSEGSWTWPLTCGSWRAYLIPRSASSLSYSSVAASEAFTVGTSAICENAVCNASPEDASPTNTHLVPSDGAQITKIAFGSCFRPGSQTNGSHLWQHVRDNFGSNSIWNWLGDNMYQDTNDSQAKRNAYNAARSNSYYTQYGPIAEPKIPTTGTWDDHDYGKFGIVKCHQIQYQLNLFCFTLQLLLVRSALFYQASITPGTTLNADKVAKMSLSIISMYPKQTLGILHMRGGSKKVYTRLTCFSRIVAHQAFI